MATLAPTLLAGTIVATALCGPLATEAQAQQQRPARSIVLNEQLQLGDVVAGQTLNVERASGEVAANVSAVGVSASGAVEGADLSLTSRQTMSGAAEATTTVTVGEAEGPVNVETQARGTYLAASVYDGDLDLDVEQATDGRAVTARTDIGDEDARLLGGASVASTAIANTTAVYGEGAYVTGVIDQSSSSVVRAGTRLVSQYIPGEADVAAQAVANAVAVNTDRTSGQDLTVRQRVTDGFVEAAASANSGNAWDLAARANAAANQAVFYNQGGSMDVATRQESNAYVRSAAQVTSYDYGAATAHARGVGNDVLAGNEDIYLKLDNDQINSGGVEVSAEVAVTQGYDSYVSAEAAGNSITGYACADCGGEMDVMNRQVNDGPVTATARTTVTSGRTIVGSAQAVGNAASFYVSRSGQ